jgi:hypothetical protein
MWFDGDISIKRMTNRVHGLTWGKEQPVGGEEGWKTIYY